MKDSVRPKFAVLQYEVMHRLDISIAEYFYLDMIYYLSREGWCYKSLESIAADMKMSKVGVSRLRDRLIHKKLVIKDAKGRVRSSVTYNKVYQDDNLGSTKYADRYTKYDSGGIQSTTKNNIKNNKEIKDKRFFNKNGTESLISAEGRLRQRMLFPNR